MGVDNLEVEPIFSPSSIVDKTYVNIVGCPTIDKGDPNDDYSNEPAPNGFRINMGAYGNTRWAATSSSIATDSSSSGANTSTVPPTPEVDSTVNATPRRITPQSSPACFIATAALEFDPNSFEYLTLLKTFRKDYLDNTAVGKFTTCAYDKMSRSVANEISKSESFRAPVKDAVKAVATATLPLPRAFYVSLMMLFVVLWSRRLIRNKR